MTSAGDLRWTNKKGIKLLSTPPPRPSHIHGTSGSSLQTLLESPAFFLDNALNCLQCFLLAQVEFVLHANQEAFKVTFTITIFSTSCQHPWRTQEDERPTTSWQHADSETPRCRKLYEQTIWTSAHVPPQAACNSSSSLALQHRTWNKAPFQTPISIGTHGIHHRFMDLNAHSIHFHNWHHTLSCT